MKDLVQKVKLITNWDERRLQVENLNTDNVPQNLGPQHQSICCSCMVPGGGCDDSHYLCGLRAEMHLYADGTLLKPALRESSKEKSRRDEYFRHKRAINGELLTNSDGQLQLL